MTKRSERSLQVLPTPARQVPPDAAERSRALDPARSFLVQAPAGSGKTYLLTQRFLRLLGEVESPDQIVAITFTIPAAAEMRNRILEALEKAAGQQQDSYEPGSIEALAAHAMQRSEERGWKLLEQSGQLRIMTIDAFCRSLALQSPLSWGTLAGLGGQLEMAANPKQLYRLAARRTLGSIGERESRVRSSVEALLLWRDNNWKDVEDLLTGMLAARSRWFQDFVFERGTDWEALRLRLEAPFRRAARQQLEALAQKMDRLEGSREFILQLSRFACQTPGKFSPVELAELAELPAVFLPEDGQEEAALLEDAVSVFRCVAKFLLTNDGGWRSTRGLTVHYGFPAGASGSQQKARFGELVAALDEEPGLLEALAVFCKPVPVRYTDAEWELVRHCFVVLREAAGHLQVAFAETGAADFTEVSQMALRILAPENGFPSDLAMRQADGVRHLLVDEFQDTSRSQYELLTRLIAAWPEREGRSCFCVGDPMQSIYGFRQAEVELFERLKTRGLPAGSETADEPFRFDFVPLRANFRSAPSLVEDLNGRFAQIFGNGSGSGVQFFPAEAVRPTASDAQLELHLAFTYRGADPAPEAAAPEVTAKAQLAEIVALIRSRLEAQRDGLSRFRIAVLGRKRSSLTPVAEALREAGIRFRAVDVVPLQERPEVVDVLSLARALVNPVDRTGWLGVLRAPWCGLSLEELYLLTSADDPRVLAATVPWLLENRLPELANQGVLPARAVHAATRVSAVMRSAAAERAAAGSLALGTWLESVWTALGGAETVTAEERENLRVLWRTLDDLPEGELDLCGENLTAAIEDLYAQPDPAASGDLGVQLMTIHKSKGLEFELVIVPDLDARENSSRHEMMVWLERGIADGGEDYDEHATEFLVAPIQAKGADAGAAKTWVSKVLRKRESDELQRLLYVAATRAREELHIFARPRFGRDAQGSLSLAASQGLMKTGWPAIGDEVERRFAELVDRISGAPTPVEVPALAAAAEESNLIPFPQARPIKPTLLRRLPADYSSAGLRKPGRSSGNAVQPAEAQDAPLYTRTEGGLESRALGTAIHALLERLSRLRTSMTAAEAADAIADWLPATAASLRTHGLTRSEAQALAEEALDIARRSSLHPLGAWILTPHPQSQAEARWTGAMGGAAVLHNLRADRVFLAPMPSAATGLEVFDSAFGSTDVGDEPAWWIIDYKTTHAGGADLSLADIRDAFLTEHRAQYSGQLELYASILRHALEGTESKVPIRVGLFYPRLFLFDPWEV